MDFDPRFLDMQPLHKRILVERVDTPSRSLIIVPDVAKEASKIAKVLRVGTKVQDVKSGDIILIPGAAAKYPDWESSDYMLITVDDVGGIFNENHDKPRNRKRA